MKTESENPVLPFKIQELLEIIMKKRALNFLDALHYLYSSELYNGLFNESAKLWYLSSLSLYDKLGEEKRMKKKSDSSKELFAIFCLENYKEYHNISAMQAFAVFTFYSVFDYLNNGYEILHTQGKAYIVDEINRFIKKRNHSKI